MVSTSYGTGQLIQAALKRGVKDIILGIGGSATVDGGIGALQALGIDFLDSSRQAGRLGRQRPEVDRPD